MKDSKVFFMILAIVLSLGIAACQTDNGVGPDETTQAASLVDEADSILFAKFALMISSGGTDTTAFDMSEANAKYQQALTADPGNKRARFGLAITGMMGMFTDPDLTALYTGRNDILTPLMIRNLLDGGVNPAHLLSILNNGSRDRLQSIVSETGLFKTNYAFPGSAQDVPPSFYQDLIETKLLPRLTNAIGHLQQVVTDQSFVILITPALLGGATADTYRIDLTEVYLLLAILQGIKADASFACAYNIDYDPGDSALVYQAWQVGSPFLGLRTNGAQRMSDTKTNFYDMATSLQNGINFLKSEPPHTEIDIIPYRPEDAGALDDVLLGLDTLKLALSGPYTVSGGPTVNFASYFDSPVSNYKTKMPPYTVGVAPGPNGYDAYLTWQASTFETWIFPDPTFNGFLPGMTDAMLKDLIGITALDWEQTLIISGI